MRIGKHTLKGDHIKTAKKIRIHKLQVLGRFLAVDPASRSIGYALYEKGKLVKSGSFEAHGEVNTRLKSIHDFLAAHSIDAMAIEYIGGSTGHRYLSWACGAIAAAQPNVPLFEIKTNLWKKFAGKDWIKGDEADAIAIGKCVVEIANANLVD